MGACDLINVWHTVFMKSHPSIAEKEIMMTMINYDLLYTSKNLILEASLQEL